MIFQFFESRIEKHFKVIKCSISYIHIYLQIIFKYPKLNLFKFNYKHIFIICRITVEFFYQNSKNYLISKEII